MTAAPLPAAASRSTPTPAPITVSTFALASALLRDSVHCAPATLVVRRQEVRGVHFRLAHQVAIPLLLHLACRSLRLCRFLETAFDTPTLLRLSLQRRKHLAVQELVTVVVSTSTLLCRKQVRIDLDFVVLHVLPSQVSFRSAMQWTLTRSILLVAPRIFVWLFP
jgi:hypothetical protein